MTRLSIQFIFASIVISILGFGLWLMYEPWFKLSKTFETELEPPETIFKFQTCILGQTYLKGCINIGIIEQKLYLSHTPPTNSVVKPLSIDLDAITKIEMCYESLFGEGYKFFIGEPNIATLVLSQSLIEKLEQSYGEPILSNKLR